MTAATTKIDLPSVMSHPRVFNLPQEFNLEIMKYLYIPNNPLINDNYDDLVALGLTNRSNRTFAAKLLTPWQQNRLPVSPKWVGGINHIVLCFEQWLKSPNNLPIPPALVRIKCREIALERKNRIHQLVLNNKPFFVMEEQAYKRGVADSNLQQRRFVPSDAEDYVTLIPYRLVAQVCNKEKGSKLEATRERTKLTNDAGALLSRLESSVIGQQAYKEGAKTIGMERARLINDAGDLLKSLEFSVSEQQAYKEAAKTIGTELSGELLRNAEARETEWNSKFMSLQTHVRQMRHANARRFCHLL